MFLLFCWWDQWMRSLFASVSPAPTHMIFITQYPLFFSNFYCSLCGLSFCRTPAPHPNDLCDGFLLCLTRFWLNVEYMRFWGPFTCADGSLPISLFCRWILFRRQHAARELFLHYHRNQHSGFQLVQARGPPTPMFKLLQVLTKT